jgi:hypothetical protein
MRQHVIDVEAFVKGNNNEGKLIVLYVHLFVVYFSNAISS